MPPIAPLVRWDYGPINNPDGNVREWRTLSEWRAMIIWGVAALAWTVFLCARYGL